MKWIGQHVYDLISRFRSDVYLEDVSTGTIASGGNLGLDSSNKIVKATEATGDIEGVTAGTNLSGGGTSGTVTLNLANASTSEKGAASFATADFDVNGGAVSLKDECVTMEYLDRNLIQTSIESFDDNDTSIMTSAAIQDKIYGTTVVGTIGTGVWEGTKIASAFLDDDTAHLSGTQTFTGTKTLNSFKGTAGATVTNILDEDAMGSNSATGLATQQSIKAYVDNKVKQVVNLKGYATLQNDVYDFANAFNSDDEAPFQMGTSYGSGTIDSGTEVTQKAFFRAGGFHVPFACTISALQTQVTCNNAGVVSIALVEYRPSDTGLDQNDYPRTVYETVAITSDNNHNKVDTTTVAAGDLDATAIPAGSHLMIMVKGDGTSVGGVTVMSVAIGLSW